MISRMREVIILAFLVLFIVGNGWATEPTIKWLNFGQIPLYIESGPYEGRGIVDSIITQVHESGLQEFNAEYLKVNHVRFDRVAREEDNCYFGWKTFPEERYFSKPMAIWFPVGVLTARQNMSRFGKEGQILSLKELLKNTSMKLGVVDGFAYQPEIRSLLDISSGRGNVIPINTADMQIDLAMLQSRPIDYIIGYPYQPVVREILQGEKNDFQFYNIVEDQNYLYVGVSCSKTKRGELVIERVNRLAEEPLFLMSIKELIEQWVYLSDQYNELFHETIMLGNSHPLVEHMVYQ